MTENPAEHGDLTLPKGLDSQKLVDAVRASGYPLQTVVARQLDRSFQIVEEWGYVDRASQEHRSLDLFASHTLVARSDRLGPSLVLLLECKRSELPYVFFAAAIPRTPHGFPAIAGLPRKKFELYRDNGMMEVPPADFLRCSDFSFVTDPPIAVTFSRVERKGKNLCLSGSVPYNSVVLPLASAQEHYCDTRSGASAQQPTFHPAITVCVCVLDAALVLASGTPELPELSTVPWVRLVHDEAVRDGSWWRRKQYFVDVVTRDFFGDYLDGRIIPFAESVAERMLERPELVIAGKAGVSDWNDWTWAELRSAP